MYHASACSTLSVALHVPMHGRFLKRPYGRIDRPKLKRKLLALCAQSGEDGRTAWCMTHAASSLVARMRARHCFGLPLPPCCMLLGITKVI